MILDRKIIVILFIMIRVKVKNNISKIKQFDRNSILQYGLYMYTIYINYEIDIGKILYKKLINENGLKIHKFLHFEINLISKNEIFSTVINGNRNNFKIFLDL